ncbi:hypothetical protein [Prevotella sp.]|uniref:hypothetical protein n=1 Tax=Prevotella sp. TaxID=59823 RepID=UPI003DA487B7
MDKNIPILNTASSFKVELRPLECPYCHKNQIPEMYNAIVYRRTDLYYIQCLCTNTDCQKVFNIKYDLITKNFMMIEQSTQIVREFSNVIKDVSPKFCDIYNEAYAAEQIGLGQITGVGYRKALEFLIKDYLISLDPAKDGEIKNKLLGQCISCDVTDEKIKQVAKRATWIGNDETHYIRKWEDKDITHLKKLIDLCLHWIEAEIETKKILEDMPEGR